MAKRQTQLDRIDKIVDRIMERNPEEVRKFKERLKVIIEESLNKEQGK